MAGPFFRLGLFKSPRLGRHTCLQAKPVTTTKAQTAASGTIESNTAKASAKSQNSKVASLDAACDKERFHRYGYSHGWLDIELIRLTNLTPLLWVRVDPMGLHGGRISVSQPDPCPAEQLFHDGDASERRWMLFVRALAERPLSMQGAGKVTTVYAVYVSGSSLFEFIGDCCLQGITCSPWLAAVGKRERSRAPPRPSQGGAAPTHEGQERP
jgi:hypothetical protein